MILCKGEKALKSFFFPIL